MPTHRHGRHEHGQNFLVDRATIAKVVALARATNGPILEIGAGDGALTVPLANLGRPLTAVEIDARLVERVCARLGRRVRLEHADFLRFRIPSRTGLVVGNLPFHLTTAILRKLLHDSNWTCAVLLTQWEVARRRAGVGGSTMMTAQWSPWFTFGLHGRVPARAFRPMPSVDGGLLAIERRTSPLVSARDRAAFQAFVHAVFTGRGHGIAAILSRITRAPRRAIDTWLRTASVAPTALPKSLTPEQWADLWARLGARAGGGIS